jgi:drug/metabolite transporter (DMT)-like permease
VLGGAVQITMFGGALAAGERVPQRRWVGAAIAGAGLVWLLWPAGAAPLPLAGTGLMAAAGLGWGIYSLRGKGPQDRRAQDATARTAANFVLASPLALLGLAAAGIGDL